MVDVGGGDGVAYGGGWEVRGVGKVGVLAGELLDQSHESRCADLNLHGVGYVHDFDGFVFVGLFGFLCGLSPVDAVEESVAVSGAGAGAAVHFGREKEGFFLLGCEREGEKVKENIGIGIGRKPTRN